LGLFKYGRYGKIEFDEA